MQNNELRIVKVDAMLDQQWAKFADNLGDIQRIAIHGSSSPEDDLLIKSVMGWVTSAIYLQSSKNRLNLGS